MKRKDLKRKASGLFLDVDKPIELRIVCGKLIILMKRLKKLEKRL